MASHYFSSHRGGVEIIAGHLFRGLSVEGHKVIWVAGDSSPAPEPIGSSYAVGLPIFNFVEDKMGLPFPVPKFRAIRRLRAEAAQADVLVLHDCLYLTNICAFILAKMRRVPVVIIQHIGLVPYKSPALRLLMRLANNLVTRPMLSYADQAVFISEITRKYFNDLHFRRKPEIVFNGVDTELFHLRRPDEHKSALRCQHGLPDNCPVILYVGRFVEKKGLPILHRMVKDRPHFMWAFAGWGPLDPDAWNAQNVRVFSGLRDGTLAALYRACDVLVLPSTGEGFPLVIQEALASGLPVVCGAETVEADQSMKSKPFVRGVPLNPTDDRQTANDFLMTLDELLGSINQPDLNPEQIRNYAMSRYSWSNALQRHFQVISRLVPISHTEALR